MCNRFVAVAINVYRLNKFNGAMQKQFAFPPSKSSHATKKKKRKKKTPAATMNNVSQWIWLRSLSPYKST